MGNENKEASVLSMPSIGINFDIRNLDVIIEKMEKIKSLSAECTNVEPIDDYLLKKSEVAVVLGVNPGTVAKIIKAGHLKALNLGTVKVRKKEVDRFMKHMEESGDVLENVYA